MSIRILLVLASTIFGSSVSLLAAPPAVVFDLGPWKLTVPYNTERKGNPDEIVQPELNGFDDKTCFYLSETSDSIIFKAACDGVGTTNSKYPRSELREMKPGGKDEASWSTDDINLHVLEAEIAIINTPTVRPHVVCAQIHDEDDDIIMIRLEADELFVERGNLEEVVLDSAYQLGDTFRLRIEAGEGRIKIWYNNEEMMDWQVSKKGCYFKIGCYTQSNLEKEKQGGSFGSVKVSQLALRSKD